MRSFRFDFCLNGTMIQEDVFRNCGIFQILRSVLDGANATVMAYGQTGSGKTFTMCGPEHNLGANPNDSIRDISGNVPQIAQQVCKQACAHLELQQGVMPRAIKALYRTIRSRTHHHASRDTYSVTVQFLQIYNEKVLDLLGGQDNVQIRATDTGFTVEGARVLACATVKQCIAAYVNGMHNRKVSATKMNHQSSRSHILLNIFITRTSHRGGEVRSKLVLVDLAGSERLREAHGYQGSAQQVNIDETTSINKSLLALGKVIASLAVGGGVPSFRESSLTKLLMDTFSGNSVALLVACVTPSSEFVDESLSTMLFATKATSIVKSKKDKRSESDEAAELRQLRDHVQSLLMITDQYKHVIVKLHREVAHLHVELTHQGIDCPPKHIDKDVRAVVDSVMREKGTTMS
eukprot:c5622_g1_i1.p1 GENE.c5622_g1_i1~~c5622_g1_i1.p1  ORF type:complete len:406 (+),score=94.08 c5622_g1_i1:628-1845(+)